MGTELLAAAAVATVATVAGLVLIGRLVRYARRIAEAIEEFNDPAVPPTHQIQSLDPRPDAPPRRFAGDPPP